MAQPAEKIEPAVDDDKLEIEFADEAPAGEKPVEKPQTESAAPAADQEPLGEEPDEDELKSYSERVRERIGKLSAQRHSERRAKEQAARERDEAAQALKAVIGEANRLKELVHRGENFIKDTAKSKLDAQISQARLDYKTAYESGDADALTKASERMSALHAELSQTNAWNPQPLPPTMEPAVVQQPQNQPDPQAQDWQTKNNWFGRDVRMTGFALGVHQELVQNGVDPRSPEYYKKIDQELAKAFPDKFQKRAEVAVNQSPSSGASVVAPAGRANAGKGPRKVTLTATQMALAKRLGVTPQQYAEQVVKLGQTDNG